MDINYCPSKSRYSRKDNIKRCVGKESVHSNERPQKLNSNLSDRINLNDSMIK